MTSLTASLLPTSPTSLVFREGEEREMSEDKKGSGAGDGGDSAQKIDDIQPKEFFWDQFLIYVSTIVALLTVLDVTLQFFRGGGLMCRIPGLVELDNVTTVVTRDEVAYVNSFCQQSLSLAEYYPLFVLIQGLILAAPHYLWASLFAGQFDFFFGLVRQLDRLRSSETGDYRTKNFDIVNKLEKQFPRKWKWLSIFTFYIAKLVLQLLVVLLSLVINAFVFQTEHFNFSFDCPRQLDPPPKGWWLPFQVTCTFTSFRLHQQLQRVNYFLLSLGFIVIIYGLVWCAKRHVNALGFKEAALFSFSSSLHPDHYVNEPFYKSPLEPGIRNDLDFLLMRLFRADSGHGRVFKDIQVERELKKREERDHELLHLYIEAAKDRSQSRDSDIRDTFRTSGFDVDVGPERKVFNELSADALGNIDWESVHTPSIRNIIFGFLQFVHGNDLAMDISFGSPGYSLILARAFKDVLSLDFHPFYANEKEVYCHEQFHADYSTFRFQENIFTKATAKLTKLEEALSEEFVGDNLGKEKQINLVLVSSFTDNAKIATVNLFLERQKNACRFAEHCLLMYLKPVTIGPQKVYDFCSYTPPSGLFQKSSDSDFLKIEKIFVQKLQNAPVSISTNTSTSDHEITADILCNHTQCQFELTVFEYKGETELIPNLPPGASPPVSDVRARSQAGNIALIIPSQMLPELEQDKIQQFMKGNMAIQLQARVPGNPIQFILPSGDRENVPPNNDDAAPLLLPSLSPSHSGPPAPKPHAADRENATPSNDDTATRHRTTNNTETVV